MHVIYTLKYFHNLLINVHYFRLHGLQSAVGREEKVVICILRDGSVNYR